jgi:hypothetical protein
MRDLSHGRERFYSITSDYSSLYNYTNKQEQLTLSAGVLNFIWNSWNNFWKEFWLAHVCGGVDFGHNPISPIYPNYKDKEACHFLLFACGKRTRHNLNDTIVGVHQEATWGDPQVIANIATKLLPHHPHMSYILGVLSIYQTTIEHFQKIRNSFIHLNNENIYNLNQIAGHYSFSNNQNLIDILESTNISSTTRCFDNLIDNMTGMLNNL